MPFCTFIADFQLDVTGHSVRVTVSPKGGLQVQFNHIVQQAFPDTRVSAVLTQSPWGTKEVFEVVSGDPEIETRLHSFLTLLQRCVTIADSLDECHALSPHKVLSNEDWPRTKVGDLVYRAKDYYSELPFRDRDATHQICGLAIEFFQRHPRYSVAGAVAPAPSSNPDVEENLPWVIASVVSEQLGKRLVTPRRLEEIPPQKGYDESVSSISREKLQEGTVGVDHGLSGTIVVIDDLYKSGGTLREVGRACRSAGASSVLGLAITKTAKGTQGMGVDSWPWG